MFAETLLLLISLHFSALLGLTSVRSSFLIDVHYHEGVFRQISLISSSSVRRALLILFSVTETCGTTDLLMEQGGYANASQNGAALNNTGSRYGRLTSVTEAAVLEEVIKINLLLNIIFVRNCKVWASCNILQNSFFILGFYYCSLC